MAMKVEIISTGKIKPSIPTPDHLRDFKMCLLDELAPQCYIPILLLYSSDEFGSNYSDDNTAMLEKLKSSLSETLSRFYPLCGTLKGNVSVECSDDGALFVETNVNVSVLEIIKNPETELLYKLVPLNPYRPKMEEAALILGVQVNFFSCGGVGIGVCISHKIADGTTAATFLNAWAASATGADLTLAPRLDSALIFPQKGVEFLNVRFATGDDKIVTKRFEFSGENLTSLKSKISAAVSNTTRVEAVTALILKSAMEGIKRNSGNDMLPSVIATHAVNIRGRIDPPLPENSQGNLWTFAISTYKAGKDVELDELVKPLKERIQKIDNGFVSELKGENGFDKAMEHIKEMRELLLGDGEAVEVYMFSSWTRFPLYEVDFGWGRPVKVCPLAAPLKNVVVLMGTKSNDGIEAWVTLTQDDMKVFESNEELLQFVSTNNP